jgi:hypothetical protein
VVGPNKRQVARLRAVCDEASGTKGVISAVDFVAVLLFRGRGELRPFEFKQVSPREILENRTGRASMSLSPQRSIKAATL